MHCEYRRRSVRSGRTSLIVLGLLVLGLVVIYGARFLFGGPSADSLKDLALNGETSQIQREAARQLADMGEPGLENLREVAQRTNNEDVISVCMAGLARQYDDHCMELFLEKLDDPSLAVRVAASKACSKILGRNHHFPAEGSLEERKRIKENMTNDWEAYNGSELHEFNKKRFKEQQD